MVEPLLLRDVGSSDDSVELRSAHGELDGVHRIGLGSHKQGKDTHQVHSHKVEEGNADVVAVVVAALTISQGYC